MYNMHALSGECRKNCLFHLFSAISLDGAIFVKSQKLLLFSHFESHQPPDYWSLLPIWVVHNSIPSPHFPSASLSVELRPMLALKSQKSSQYPGLGIHLSCLAWLRRSPLSLCQLHVICRCVHLNEWHVHWWPFCSGIHKCNLFSKTSKIAAIRPLWIRCVPKFG